MTILTDWQRGFGERLRRHRTHAGWNQQALARALSVDRSLVSRWESGDREPGMWDAIRAAHALGVPVSALVVGPAGLPGGPEVVWRELAWRGADLQPAGAVPLWSLRPVHETIADALLHPEPRVIDQLPGLLLIEDVLPRALWGQCADLGVERRLGWIADIALGIAHDGRIATPPWRVRALRIVLSLVARPEVDEDPDSLGYGTPEPGRLPPVFRRWRIEYDGELGRFEAAATQLDEVKQRGVLR